MPQGCQLALATSIPMYLAVRNSKIAIPATLDSAGITLMVDTGAQATLLSDTVVAGIERTEINGTIRGIGGARFASWASLRRLDLGRLHGAVGALTTKLGPVFTNNGFAGLLGMDIMGAYDVDLDVAGGELRLFSAIGSCAAVPTVLSPPLYAVAELDRPPQDVRPFVPVGIGGQQFVGILDTGSPGVALSARAAKRLGLDAAALSRDRVVHLQGVGTRGVTGHAHMLRELTLGELTLRNVPVVVMAENFDPRVDVLLGFDIARRIHFWISNSTHKLVMQYPAVASPKL